MIKHKQTTGYGCGMYSVANALNLDSFATPERLEESRTGNTIYQLNKWLDEDGYKWNIECLYHTSFTSEETGHGVNIPKEAQCYSDSETKAIPILINVQNGNSKTHMIAAWLRKDNLIVLDSLADDVVGITWDRLNTLYKFVYGIWVFQERSPNSTGYVCFEHEVESYCRPATFN